MSLPAVVALMLVARVAAADRTIAVEVEDTPFAAADLESAIRVRSPADGAPLRLRVIGIDHGRTVRIESPRGDRDVELGDTRGVAAARLVALVASDLWLDDLAAPPGRIAARERWRIGATVGVAGWSGTLGTAGVEVVIPRAGWLVACEVAGAQLLDDKLQLDGAVVRVAAGVRTGWLELRGGIVALPLFVASGVGDQTVLLGAAASARIVAPLGGGLHAVGGVGIDAFATRTEYRFAGMTALATPRWAPWVAGGIEVEL